MSTLKLKGSSSGEAEVTVAAAAGTPTFTLPTTVGSANQLLKNSGTAGTLEYSSNLTFDGTTLKTTASTDAELKITAGNATSQSRLLFEDSAAVDGVITYDHNDRLLHIGAGTSTATDGDLIVNSSGNVGIGTTSPGGFKLRVEGGDSDEGLHIHTGNSSSQWLIRAEDNAANQRFVVKADGEVVIGDGNLVIGTSGHGIDFSANSNGPGTSVSELFHTYEEGYWVPTFNNNFTIESSYQNFQYTRVGRLVTVRGYVYPSSWSGSDSIYLTLPFASLNDADAANSGAGGCMFRYIDGCTGGLASYVGDNASAMYFYRCESGNSNYSALTTGNLQTGALWYFSHTYAAA